VCMNALAQRTVAAFSVLLGTSLAAPASAQNAPSPAGMQAGGLAPPSPQSGPAAPQRAESGTTQRQLDEANAEDSGRGLDLVFFAVEGGFEHVALQNLHASTDLVAAGVRTNDTGSMLGATAGFKMLFFSLGPRFRFGHFHDWDLWTLDLELGWHVPLGNLEPYARLGGGYSRLTRSADGAPSARSDVTVKGYNVRLGLGVDYYVTNVFSVGALLTADLIGLSRAAIAQAGFYGADSSALGLGFAGSAVAGLHF
jgi:hypothetical protein